MRDTKKHMALIIFSITTVIFMSITGCIQEPTTEVKWGISLHYKDMSNPDVDKHIVGLGVELIRFDIHWKEVEVNNNNFDFTKYDNIVNKYGADRFVIVLISLPDWAKDLYETDKEQYWSEWQDYVKEVATRYNFYYYQVDNEMNHIVGTLVNRWLYDYDDRPIVIQKTGETLNQYDKTHKLIVNVMANSPNWYGNLDNWLDKAGEHIDMIGVDHYSETWTARTNKWRPLNLVLEETIRSGSSFYGKDVCICEMGYSTYREGTHGDIQQERWINTELTELKEIVNVYNTKVYNSKFVFAIWYTLYEGGDTFDYNPESHFGIVDKDGVEKMGYDALKEQIAKFN